MGKIYQQDEILTAADLNNSLSEFINTNGYFVITGVTGSPLLPYVDPESGLTITPNPMTGERIHNAPLTANGGFVVNTSPSYFISQSNFYSNSFFYSNVAVSAHIFDYQGDVRAIKRNPSVPPGYTITTSDIGKFLYATGAVNIVNGVLDIGDNITIYNSTSGTININQVSGTIFLAGIGLTGNRTLDTKGLCTLLCVDTNTYTIIGAGLN